MLNLQEVLDGAQRASVRHTEACDKQNRPQRFCEYRRELVPTASCFYNDPMASQMKGVF
ncbi:hypothetical protein predicted by Glimmer/Critica (plasmid) [Sinorhizobium fredii HH103]|uniref:Uncharacterized protein n=1 Tax=Sinorhizobium fredii (strain HH103) TaxID=1117943 RepID=G9AGQ0_SINF1|nr:hypothetical protein predicted by Glimmer/Critica [Sinorhizobium fredii HH103]